MGTMLGTAALAVVLCSAPSSAATIRSAATSALPTRTAPLVLNAQNWAGYAAESNFFNPQNDSVTAVSGSWIVPAATPSANPAANANGQLSDCVQWVGIDGVTSDTVEQVGTESYMYNGVAGYDAWFEMYPAGLTPVISVSPGDSITASVQYGLPSSSFPNQFQLSLTDNTSGANFTLYEPDTSPALRTSAEWIVEAPSDYQGILPLPTFGSAAFSNAQATIGSTTGAINNPAWQLAQVNMSDPAWNDAMTPSDITTVGSGPSASSSFTVTQAPEPSTLVILASAVAVVGLRASARQRRIPVAND
jgi:hypothetical protein